MQSTARMKMVLLKEAKIGHEMKKPGAVVEVSRGAAKSFLATETARLWTSADDKPAAQLKAEPEVREPEVLDARDDSGEDSQQHAAASESDQGSSRRHRRTNR